MDAGLAVASGITNNSSFFPSVRIQYLRKGVANEGSRDSLEHYRAV